MTAAPAASEAATSPKAIVGAGPSSRFVARPVPLAIVALVGADSLSENVSFGSSSLSPRTGTVIVLEVWPFANESVPEEAVKSDPATAVPSAVAYLTATDLLLASER